MDTLKDTKSILSKVYGIAKKEDTSLYIVGGFIRDLLTKPSFKYHNIIDIDFSLDQDAVVFTGKIATLFKTKCILLDREFNTARVVIKRKNYIYQLDFTEFKADNINKDLLCRDFTINAFAIGLLEFIELKSLRDLRKRLIFPKNALEDFKNKKIIHIRSNTFKEDPLRIVRVFSIAAQLGFKIDNKTLSLAKRYYVLLNNISAERIRDEIFRLLSADKSYPYIKLMADYDILDKIFSELKGSKDIEQGPYHHLDVYYHSIECIKEFEMFLPRIYKDKYLNQRIRKFLEEDLAYKRNRLSLIKLALLYHDVGKPDARRIENDKIKFWGHEKIGRDITKKMSERFKLSNLEKRTLENIVYYHLRPGNLVGQDSFKNKATYRFFRQVDYDVPSLILLSVADKYATRGKLITKKSMKLHRDYLIEILKEYFHIKEKVQPKKLISGNDIIRILKIKPSREVGKILEEVKILQMQGKLKNKKQALEFIKKHEI